MAIYVTGISTPDLHLESPPLLGTPTARVQLLDETNKSFTANVDDIVVDQMAG